MIKAILFDIDDTLLDFRKSSELSLKEACADFKIPYSEDILITFFETTFELWSRIESGTLSRPELYKVRWNNVFSKLGISFDGILFEKAFRSHLYEKAIPVSGATEILKSLYGRYILCVASNAPFEQQINRLNSSGMLEYISHVFISEKIGYEKPSPLFFDFCIKELSPLSKNEVLIVGDSLNADILGGSSYGIKTCWLDRGFSHNSSSDVKPDFTVTSLSEVENILNKL